MKPVRIILLSIVGTFFYSVGFAQELEVIIVNKTRKQIEQVFISPNEDERWGKDVLGQDVLDNLDRVTLDISEDYGDTCSFDLKVIYDDGTNATWSNLDFCKYLTFAIEPRGIVHMTVK